MNFLKKQLSKDNGILNKNITYTLNNFIYAKSSYLPK